ncbi:MAG: metal ABC transporter substrate-binding protein [Oscillospiraceae bacterium]|nr:metal ABC transporter substrate-binding protein [Oscillospiraceae bacterium]
MQWKRILCGLLCGTLLCGCTPMTQTAVTKSSEKLELVTTLFCYYDFARAVLKNTDTITINLLLSPGMESHSFEPAPSDILAIQNADIFVYNGGHMEHWVEAVLESDEQSHPDRIIRCMMDFAPLLEETELEGSELEHDHDHEHNHDHEHETGETHEMQDDHDHEDTETCTDPSHDHSHDGESDIEYDEHIWTSPKIAKDLLYVVCNAICEADPANAAIYRKNADAYAAELKTLHEDFTAYFSEPEHQTLLFADRFPLQYFANTYDLHCYAAFSGCSSDTEPSVATISHLMKLAETYHLSKVYYLEVSSPSVANVISEQTGAIPTIFQSCHTITQTDFDNGETYVSLMRRNLQALQNEPK